MERIKEYKDQAKQVSEDQPTDKPPSVDGKPSFDEIQGFQDLKQDLVERWIPGTDTKTLEIFHEMIHTETAKRNLWPSPDVA